LVGSYRKVHLPQLGVDRFATPGDRPLAVHQAGEVKIGMNICYDASFPETGRVLALAGAELIVLPTNWPPGAETTAEHVPNARALENKVYFIAANRVGRERGFQFIGHSKISDVHGNTLAAAAHQQEEIIYADIDPAEARDKRIERVPGRHAIHRFDDRRPDMYGSLL
jgi:predicted amidohydrolase